MSERRVHVTLTIHAEELYRGLSAAARAAAAIDPTYARSLSAAVAVVVQHHRHRQRHHQREIPELSRMHAAYDHRRRARRKGRR